MSRLPYRGQLETREIVPSASPVGQPWPIVYGKARVTCPIIHLHLASTSQLELVAVISIGEIDAVEKVYVSGQEVYPSSPAWAAVEVRLGTSPQDPPTILRHPDWSSGLPGVAYVAMRLSLATAPVAGMPQVVAVARGRKISPSGGYTTAMGYALRDLLSSTIYGGGLAVASDWDTVAGGAATPGSLVVASRSTIDQSDRVIQAILAHIHGRIYWDGAWRLRLDSAASSVGTVSFSGPIRLLEDPQIEASIAETPNRVRASYVDPSDWQERQVLVETAAAATGEEAPRDVDLGRTLCTSYQDTVRLCKTALARARAASRAITLMCDGTARDATPGTRITLQHAVTGSVELLVTDQIIYPDGRYELQCVPWSSSDWDSGTYTAPSETPGSTVSSAEIMLIRDDFLSGGTTSGTIGEMGWNIAAGTPSISYPTVAGRYGVLGVMGTGSELRLTSVSVDGSAPWSLRAIMRLAGETDAYTGLGTVLVSRDGASGTWRAMVGSTVVASLSTAGSTWITADLSWASGVLRAQLAGGSFRATGTWSGTLSSGSPRIGVTAGINAIQLDLYELAVERS
jgi:hypothetical protein